MQWQAERSEKTLFHNFSLLIGADIHKKICLVDVDMNYECDECIVISDDDES